MLWARRAVRTRAVRQGSEYLMERSNWQERLATIVETMREMSRHTDPQEMVSYYASRVRKINPSDRSVSISRRSLPAPLYKITRSTLWKESINPWQEAQDGDV